MKRLPQQRGTIRWFRRQCVARRIVVPAGRPLPENRKRPTTASLSAGSTASNTKQGLRGSVSSSTGPSVKWRRSPHREPLYSQAAYREVLTHDARADAEAFIF